MKSAYGQPCALFLNPFGKDKMSRALETDNMAVLCDFENVAPGVLDTRYAQFDMKKKVLEGFQAPNPCDG